MQGGEEEEEERERGVAKSAKFFWGVGWGLGGINSKEILQNVK